MALQYKLVPGRELENEDQNQSATHEGIHLYHMHMYNICQTAHICSLINSAERLVGWTLTSLFRTNMAISETKGQGWTVILTQ